ncbi:hypothetical protein [Mucilaginibacter gracilis]|uniref:hypothetical protein n=1 Tax=Mucilaginibacter gracilis TaxID=423350 RepID=UPI0011C37BC2|nr:hypothetical protein [Mucilaginibacter gracilis]
MLRLLTKAGINAQPLAVSTRDHGVIDPVYPNIYDLNKTVVYIPLDSTRYYVLDATNKYNLYTDVPIDLLNTYGLMVKREGIYVSSKLILLQNQQPTQRVVIINGDINANGHITGTADISNYTYNKTFFARLYNDLDKKVFINFLRDNNNAINVNDLAVENMEADSLPLVHKIKFNQELTTTDDKYIYFDSNIFTAMRSNPFLSEQRVADIDFETCAANSINEHLKLPPGYKADVLPANVLVRFADNSITFKRVVGEANGFVEVHYTITRSRAKYQVAEYPALRQFYKKMYDMLNEPVVLKKL